MRAISAGARIGKVCARRASSVGDAGSALGGMLVLGFVAAADVSAGPAQAQTHPGIAHLEAFLAAFAARPVGPHQTEVTALHFSRCTSPRLRAGGRAPGTHRRRFRAKRAAGAKDPSIGPAPPGPPPGACSCPERARPARTAGALQLPGAGYGRVQTRPFPAVPRFTSLGRLTRLPIIAHAGASVAELRRSLRLGCSLPVLVGKQSDQAVDTVVAHLLAERGPVIRRQADPANADIEDFPARRGLFHCVIDGDRLGP